MSGNVEWHGDEFKREVHTAMGRKIKRACLVVVRRAKVLLSVSGTGVRVRGGLTKHGKTLARKKRTEFFARKINVGVKQYNKAVGFIDKHVGKSKLKKIKTKFRATKSGKLTSRKRRRKKKP